MRGILIFLLAIGLFFLSTTAEGADWEWIAVIQYPFNLVEYFVDDESIRHVSETVVRAWVKRVSERPESVNSKFITSQMAFQEHNCKMGSYRHLQLSEYYSDGTSFNVTNPLSIIPREWTFATSESASYYIHKYLCKSKK